MPSSKNPATVVSGAGRASADTVSASALSFPIDTQILGDQLAIEIAALSFGKITRGSLVLGGTDNVVISSSSPTYLGGSPNPDITELFQVVGDATNQRLLNAAGTDYIKADSLGGGSIGDIWSSASLTVTLDEAPTVPWNLIYATKKNMKDLEEDMFSQAKLLNFPTEQDRVLNLLHGGLDSRYRASTLTEATTLDEAGSGSVITRDGPAPQSKGIDQVYTTSGQDTSLQPDPYLSNWRSEVDSFGSTSLLNTKSGELGYLFLTAGHQYTSDNEYNSSHHPLSNFTSLRPMDIRGATLGGNAVRTRIPSTAPADLNVGGTLGDSIDLTGGTNFFHDGTNSAIRVGIDLLLVTFGDATQQAYIVKSLTSATQATVVTLGGAGVVFAADESVTVQWIQVVSCNGGAVGGDNADVDWAGLGYYNPPLLTSDTTPGDTLPIPPTFVASSVTPTDATTSNENSIWALKWGGYNPETFASEVRGSLRGDGSIITTKGVAEASFRERHRDDGGTGTSVILDVNPIGTLGATPAWAGYSCINYACTAALSTVVSLLVRTDITAGAAYTPQPGDRITVVIINENGANINMTWSASDFRFSGSDATIPHGVVATYKWEGIYTKDTPSTYKFLMTRTDY